MKAIIVFVIFPYFLFSQEITDKFTRLEIEKFVSVWTLSKSINVNRDSILLNLLKDNNISGLRYGQILRAKIEGQNINITDQERRAFEKITSKNEEIQSIKNQKVAELCLKKGLPFQTYKDIELKFKEDVHFQSVVRQIITKYAQGNEN